MIGFPLLADSRPKGVAARDYGVYLECEETSSQALFVIDERGLVRWSRTYPHLHNPGIDGILHALDSPEPMEDADEA